MQTWVFICTMALKSIIDIRSMFDPFMQNFHEIFNFRIALRSYFQKKKKCFKYLTIIQHFCQLSIGFSSNNRQCCMPFVMHSADVFCLFMFIVVTSLLCLSYVNEPHEYYNVLTLAADSIYAYIHKYFNW